MRLKYISVISFVVLAIFLAVVFVIGGILSAPNQTKVGEMPALLKGEKITFDSLTGNSLSGWFIKGLADKGGVLLMHGVRSNRREMIGRAIFLNQSGYSVLLFDFQAHGESAGKHITFGYLEAKDAEAAFTYLEKRIEVKTIGVVGMSLGGASAILGNVSQRASAIVMEAVYPTLKQAVENRISMRLGMLGRYLTPLIMLQIEPRLGFSPHLLEPIRQLSTLKVPLFIVAGTEDEHTTLFESKQMYDEVSGPKQMWAVQGAAHEDFYKHTPSVYKKKILDFFSRYLQ